MIERISENYGNLTVSRDKKHRFLGMDIEFLADGKLSLFMKDYIEESIDLFREKIISHLLRTICPFPGTFVSSSLIL